MLSLLLNSRDLAHKRITEGGQDFDQSFEIFAVGKMHRGTTNRRQDQMALKSMTTRLPKYAIGNCPLLPLSSYLRVGGIDFTLWPTRISFNDRQISLYDRQIS